MAGAERDSTFFCFALITSYLLFSDGTPENMKPILPTGLGVFPFCVFKAWSLPKNACCMYFGMGGERLKEPRIPVWAPQQGPWGGRLSWELVSHLEDLIHKH